jgi:hypothetical protein
MVDRMSERAKVDRDRLMQQLYEFRRQSLRAW